MEKAKLCSMWIRGRKVAVVAGVVVVVVKDWLQIRALLSLSRRKCVSILVVAVIATMSSP